MPFSVGETVVYPHHGAAEIVRIVHREIAGEDVEYLVLHVTQSELEIEVPSKNVDLVGVREVVDDAGVESVLDVLRAVDVEEPSNWSRRFKANQEKIATGNILRVSEVVRDLHRREVDKGLSAGEKRLLAKARQILISELKLARDTDEETVSAELDQILADGVAAVEAAD